MSNLANPDLAHVWLDGDAYRAPAGTALPANIFADTLASPWVPFGGVKAGFQYKVDQNVKKIDVWNNTSGAPYKTIKEPPEPTISMIPVDYSKATVLTLIRGGSVAETATDSGVWELIQGEEEEFALILVLRDGDDRKAYYIEKAELNNLPEENMGDKDDLEQFPMEIGPLAPGGGRKAVRKFLSVNPLAA